MAPRTRQQPAAARKSLDPGLRAAHAAMMSRYFDEGWSAGAIAKAFGRSPGFISKLVRAEKLRGRRRRKTGGSLDPRKRENRLPLSAAHCSIGVHVMRYRRFHNLNMAQFGLRVRLSRVRVGELEAGAYDLTLGELVAISEELGLSPRELSAGHVRLSRAAYR